MRIPSTRGGPVLRLLAVVAAMIVASVAWAGQALAADTLTPALVNKARAATSPTPDAAAIALDATRNPAAVQFLVVLGDAPPHNSPAPSVAPACGNQPPADVGINSTSEIAGLNAKDITLLMINYD